MLPQNIRDVADFFNQYWPEYKSYISENRNCHREMLAVLNQFLRQNWSKRSFSFVDAGCGDSSMIGQVLQRHRISTYIGIDVAEKVIKMASSNLANLKCEKKFITDNMIHAVENLPFSVDIIFSCHAIHLLSYQEKIDFIHTCKNKLSSEGFFIMIDGVMGENLTRNQWLQIVEDYYKTIYPDISVSELNRLNNHYRNRVFPERIETFAQISRSLGWKGFRILTRIGAIAFMVFSKSDCLIHSINLRDLLPERI